MQPPQIEGNVMVDWAVAVRAFIAIVLVSFPASGDVRAAVGGDAGHLVVAADVAPDDSTPLLVDQVEVVVDDGSPAAGPSEPGETPPRAPVVDPEDGPLVADAQGASAPGRVETDPVEVADAQMLGVTWPEDADVEGLDPQVRLHEDGAWSQWTALDSDIAPDAGTADARTVRGGTDSLWIADADAVQLSFAASPQGGPDDVRLALVKPDQDAGSASAVGPAVLTGQQAMVRTVADPNAPVMITRDQWGARPQACQPDVATALVGAVVHHTAGSNSYTTVAQAEAQIRGDQAYHIDGRGWCDLGYNFVVDKWGNLYEGRAGSLTQPVIGVHAGGFNTGTVGVAMLGTYDSAPPQATIQSVGRIIGWRLGAYGVEPTGSMSYWTAVGENSRYQNQTVVLPRIFGHRDVAYTACPGNGGYAALGAIRAVAATVAAQVREEESIARVSALYRDMLRREVDNQGLYFWVSRALLDGNVAGVSTDIAHSIEFVRTQITEAYLSLLGRGPDPAGLATWTGEITAGRLRVEDLRERLAASDEFWALSGSTVDGYVARVYASVLGRAAASSEVAFWAGVAQTSGRGTVAKGVWYSAESAQLRVGEVYQTFLGRTPDPAGLATWPALWVANGDDALRAGIVTSAEYLDRAVRQTGGTV